MMFFSIAFSVTFTFFVSLFASLAHVGIYLCVTYMLGSGNQIDSYGRGNN